jgi:UTP--glucose-1-phosphate uridylyltransferase
LKVNTAVIPAAGLGTRFLPVTKSVPKELIPVIDKAGIQYAVEEAAAAGIENIVIITSKGKDAIADYFNRDEELEDLLYERGHVYYSNRIKDISSIANISYVIQDEQLGLGHAVMCAANSLSKEPFAVILPDDLIIPTTSVLNKLLNVFKEYQSSVIAVQSLKRENINQYGIIETETINQGLFKVLNAVEKPAPDDAPSNLGIVGRYVFTPEIFESISKVTPGSIGEIQLTDGISNLIQYQSVYALEITGTRHDIGTPLGLLKASISIGLEREDIAKELLDYITELTNPYPK